MTLPIVVADTSVLINFLKIDRMDLVGRYPGRLLATDHVQSELADDYPEQRARYEAAVTGGFLDTCSVTDPAEVSLFGRLGPGVRLGAGECSAIAVALSRGFAIAIDDNRAIKIALREAELAGKRLIVLRTQDIVVALIRASALTVEEADRVKAEWEQRHRFRLKVRSFQDLLASSLSGMGSHNAPLLGQPWLPTSSCFFVRLTTRSR